MGEGTSPSRSLTTFSYAERSQAAAITGAGLAPAHESESAIMADLSPGNYTAVVSGVNGAAGIALVEAYHLQ